MRIERLDDRASAAGPAQRFTGQVWLEPVIHALAPGKVRAYRVTFAPGARTHWHTHPLGQTLSILAERGLVQARGVPRLSQVPGPSPAGPRPAGGPGQPPVASSASTSLRVGMPSRPPNRVHLSAAAAAARRMPSARLRRSAIASASAP